MSFSFGTEYLLAEGSPAVCNTVHTTATGVDFLTRIRADESTLAEHVTEVRGVEFMMDDALDKRRFTFISALGQGTFGVVALFGFEEVKFAVKFMHFDDKMAHREVDIIDNFNRVDMRRNNHGDCHRVAAAIVIPRVPQKMLMVALEAADGSLHSLCWKEGRFPVANAFDLTRCVLEEAECIRKGFGNINMDIKVENYLYKCTTTDTLNVMSADYGGFCKANEIVTSTTFLPPWLIGTSDGYKGLLADEPTALYQVAPLFVALRGCTLGGVAWSVRLSRNVFNKKAAEECYADLFDDKVSPKLSEDEKTFISFVSRYIPKTDESEARWATEQRPTFTDALRFIHSRIGLDSHPLGTVI